MISPVALTQYGDSHSSARVIDIAADSESKNLMCRNLDRSDESGRLKNVEVTYGQGNINELEAKARETDDTLRSQHIAGQTRKKS
jgi:hypothetical protein